MSEELDLRSECTRAYRDKRLIGVCGSFQHGKPWLGEAVGDEARFVVVLR